MYHACNFPLKTLAPLGLNVFRGYLLVLDLNVLYTSHALSRWLGLSYIRVSTHASLGAHLRGLLSWLDHRANWSMPADAYVWCLVQYSTCKRHSNAQVRFSIQHSVVRALYDDVPYSWNLCYLYCYGRPFLLS